MDDMARNASEGPQLRTLLLTDLVDSTGLVERMGDLPASELFREHDRLVLKLQQAWRGRLIDRSDGLLLLFERPIDGLGFALDYTRGLHDLGVSRGLQLQARAGLHVGEVLTWKNSDAAVQVGAKPLEVEGLAKPMAARLMSLARPGQILLSAVAESLTRRASRELGERGSNLLWKSYGHWRFKGVLQAQEIYEVGEVGLAPLRAPASIPKAWRDTPLWRRPAALAAELLLVVGLGVGVWFLTKPQPAIAFAERDWVVVGDLRNLTGEKVLDDSLAEAFRISLEQSRYVNLLSDMKARDTLARMQRKPDTLLDRAVASEIALRDGARAVILPTVSEVGGRVRFSAEVIDPRTQTTVYAETADGAGAGSALDSIDKVTAKLRGALGEALASIDKDSEPLPQVTSANLDALRSYALGQKAFAHSDYPAAGGYYAHAVELDPAFALAEIGLLRVEQANNNESAGLAHLRRAQSFRNKLTPRDQLYLEAWAARIDAPAHELGKWERMANLYPDDFPAAMNVAYLMIERNRYADGLAAARRADSPKNPAYAQTRRLVGDFLLAQGRYADADKMQSFALAQGVQAAAVRKVLIYAAQGKFADAGKAWQRVHVAKNTGVRFDQVTLQLDQADWGAASREASLLKTYPETGTTAARSALYPLAISEWLSGNEKQALRTVDELVTTTLAAMQAPRSNSDAVADAYGAISGALLAQRMGARGPAQRVLQKLGEHPGVFQVEPVAGLVEVLQAGEALLNGKSDAAIARLERLLKGDPPFQAHTLLLSAYVAGGKVDQAKKQADWLEAHRGMAYIEQGCGWCQQPLNVADTTLSHLATAELLAKQGRADDARAQLEVFDRRWPPAKLPDHLRVRRTALDAFN
ncbi:MAG: putative peptide modification system cyclase [Pseudoxanthomonas sp.]